MIQQIVNMNNSGVSFLAAGDSLNALKSFKSALVLMGRAGEDDDFMRADTIVFGPSVQVVGLEDPYFYVYNQALLLDASATDLTWANSCVLFNLALAFHHKGLTSCDATKLQKALRMYDLTAQLIFEADPSATALAIAALNNQASVFYSLGDYPRAQERLDSVRQAADLLPASSASPLEPVCLDEIFLNVAIVRPPAMAPCA
ncbi:expressed unknown protein [Seminavis robusta]|uniref:Uncharacterized protein n=1 Tax=Seminavis robusta TaxID=568900 RepID=A0A9N8DY02_9STRA|nr:expressed unknown protein [Seminavis robusta]|eukprot:Sro331_g119030.1 n/a (202) ;mRNA; r:11254-11859